MPRSAVLPLTIAEAFVLLKTQEFPPKTDESHPTYLCGYGRLLGPLSLLGSTGPGGSGLGRVAVRTPVDVRWISAGFRVGQGGSGGKLGACVGRGAAVRCFGIGAEGCFGSAPSSSADGRGRGARGAEARGVSALGGRGGCVLGGASEGRGRSWIYTSTYVYNVSPRQGHLIKLVFPLRI